MSICALVVKQVEIVRGGTVARSKPVSGRPPCPGTAAALARGASDHGASTEANSTVVLTLTLRPYQTQTLVKAAVLKGQQRRGAGRECAPRFLTSA